MNKKCTVIIVLLLLVIGGGVYKFIFQGSVSESTDGRMAIHLNSGERDLVLGEMRMFLENVQQITIGVNEDDMAHIAKSARIVGRAAQAAVPGTLMGKLPAEFKALGFDTHNKFDELASNAEQFGDPAYSLRLLTELMNNCVSCHAAYKINTPAAGL
jgi:hypothetical protein